MTLHDSSWDVLPSPVVESILSLLPPRDRCRAGQTCRGWYHSSFAPSVWRTLTITFIDPAVDLQFLNVVQKYTQHIRRVDILVDQLDTRNRANACRMLNMLASIGKLMSIKVAFVGENPLFYAGRDFLDELKNIFKGQGDCDGLLRQVDIQGLPINLDNDLIYLLARNNPRLESLNIVNQVIVCKVHPDSVLNLAEQCKHLTDLRLYHCSITEDVIRALSNPDRTPIRNLGIFCRTEQTFITEIPSDVWVELAKQCPDLGVTLGFDHTCPLSKVSAVMTRGIPVRELLLETHTDISDEVVQAADYYSQTLEKVVLQTWNSPQLADSLIRLCGICSRLHTLLVYCVLDHSVVETILGLCPAMARRGTYILKWTLDPEPWLMTVEERHNLTIQKGAL